MVYFSLTRSRKCQEVCKEPGVPWLQGKARLPAGLEMTRTKKQVEGASYVKALSFGTKGRGSKEGRQHLAPFPPPLPLKMMEIDLDSDFSSFLPKEIN